MMTLRKGLPAWAWLLGATALLYLALWGGTFFMAVRHVQDCRAWCEKHPSGVFVPLKSFDPSIPPPKLQPDDPNEYVFIGHLRCPCPLVIFWDGAAYTVKRGQADRVEEIWWGKDWKAINNRNYWSY
jgi:hypothetical protein